MGHKCFISYKKEDIDFKNQLSKIIEKNDIIDKSLDRIIDSYNGDYIMQTIRENYLSDSTVTLFLIGVNSSEQEGRDYLGREKNYFLQKELQASLFNGKGNTRNGIVGLVLPSMYDTVYKGNYTCTTCGGNHNLVNIDDSTVIREFSKNYYIEPHNGCAWNDEERYCILVRWDEFFKNSEYYIQLAFDKRFSEISKKTRIYNLR